MANDLNRCEFIGRLGKDPEIRYSSDGKPIANFSVACGSSWKDKNSGEKQESTEWIRLVAFGKLAEIIGSYLHKGSQIYIAGRMQTRKYQDKEGKDRYTTEIVADQMQMLGGRGNGGSDGDDYDSRTQSAPHGGQQKPANRPPVDNGDFDDDIPF